jgi:PAS domain S-box-containing protein
LDYASQYLDLPDSFKPFKEHSFKTMSMSKKSFLRNFIILFIMIIFALAYIRYIWVKAENEQTDNLLQIARSIEATLPINNIKSLRAKAEDIENPDYKKIKETLMAVIRVNPLARFAYLYTEKNDTIRFLADSEPESSSDYSPPGQIYDEAKVEDLLPFRDGEERVTAPMTDRWGTWRSTFVPIKDQQTGQVIAVFGMDFNADTWNKQMAFKVLQSSLVLILLMVVIFIFFLRNKLLNHDITIRKKAEDILELTKQSYLDIINTISEAIYIIDPSGTFIDVNKGAEKMYLSNKDYLVGRTPADVSAEGMNDLVKIQAQMQEVFLTGNPVTFEFWGIRKNNEIFPKEVIVNKGRYFGKDVLVATARDITERKQAGRELIKLRKAIDGSTDAVFMTDKEGLFTFINPGFTTTYGFTADEIIGKLTPRILKSGLMPVEMYSNFWETLLSGQEIKGELRNKRKDGVVIDVEGSTNAILDENNEIIGFLGIQRDITERKQTEALFRDIIEKNPMSIQIMNKDGFTIQTNSAHTRLFGARIPEDYSIFNDTQLLQQGFGELFDKIKKGEVVYFPDSYFNVHDVDPTFPDVLAWIRTVGFALMDSSGVPERIVLMHENITDRKHAEDLFQDIIDKNPLSIQIVDKDGYTIAGNPAYSQLFGALPPSDFSIFEDLKLRNQELESLIQIAKSGEVVHLPDLYYNPKDTSPDFPDFPLWIRALIFPLNDSSGKPERFVFIHENITERKKTEEELITAKEKAIESDRLKSAFLANMSHEIRTPMNGILGFAELLKEPELSGNQQKEYVEIIEKSGARMLNIINDIIDISKIESGQMKVTISDTNINEQIDFIYAFFKPEAEQKGIELICNNSLSDKETLVKTDSEKVYAILTNLIKNAVKFTQKGCIEFGCDANTINETVLLNFYVKDSGIGINIEKQKIIFERFRQENESLTRNFEGAGLGLAISKAYVEMLGGTIWIESEPGKGSIFYFTIPVSVEPAEKTLIKNETSAGVELIQGRKLKILIAEDDEGSEKLLKIVLKTLSNNILIARDGLEAVEICRNNPDLDCILMDIQMPQMNGYEATQQIRKFNSKVLIIAQTAFALSSDREKAIDSGCDDYITKPIRRADLIALIQSHNEK